jgi:hypothetical protein
VWPATERPPGGCRPRNPRENPTSSNGETVPGTPQPAQPSQHHPRAERMPEQSCWRGPDVDQGANRLAIHAGRRAGDPPLQARGQAPCETGHIPGTSCRHLPRDDENCQERNRRSWLVCGASPQVGRTRDLDPAYRPARPSSASVTCGDVQPGARPGTSQNPSGVEVVRRREMAGEVDDWRPRVVISG